jgi:hypothetical protein
MNTKALKKIITTRLTGTAIAVTAATALGSMTVNASEYKHVAVAPEKINAQNIQSAQSKGLFSHSTMLPIYSKNRLSTLAGADQFEQKIILDGSVDSPVVLLSPDAEKWFVSITNPSGKMVYDEMAAAARPLDINGIQVGPQSFKGKQFSIPNPIQGEWTIKLTHKGGALSAAVDKNISAYLLFKGDNQFQAYSYLDNNFTTQNNDINVVAQMVDATSNRSNRALMVQKKPVAGTINSAVATIKSPSGKYFTLSLNDDGLDGDKIANDGRYSAKAPTSEVGVYTNQVQIQGVRPNGKAFSRTTTDIYPIAAKSFAFSKAPAQLKLIDNTSAIVSVPVKRFDDTESVFMAAQIWGTDSEGKQQPAAWAGGIVSPNLANKLELSFDTRWLTRQNLQAPYSLKSVRLQSVDTNVPLAQQENIALHSMVPTKRMATASAARLDAGLEITPDMLMGKAPARVNTKTMTASATGSKLLLVHGYCSSQAWYANEFYNAAEFQDYNQSISHDTFAQRVKNFGAGYASYGIVAHSQGGAAALHLYSKYWSGLDYASSGSLIQSVGTPYQGTALAGNLAAIGDVFGAGCGTNTDLTYNGASNWLSTIPSWAKNKVEFYTTSFDTAWWSYDYCHLATDLFLDDPEDGTTEKWSGQLSGGINKGHKKGQCHTGGMRDPAQTRDGSRNSSMDSRAAR